MLPGLSDVLDEDIKPTIEPIDTFKSWALAKSRQNSKTSTSSEEGEKGRLNLKILQQGNCYAPH